MGLDSIKAMFKTRSAKLSFVRHGLLNSALAFRNPLSEEEQIASLAELAAIQLNQRVSCC